MANNYYAYSALQQSYASVPTMATAYVQPAIQTAYGQPAIQTAYGQPMPSGYAVAAPSAPQYSYESYISPNVTYVAAQPPGPLQYPSAQPAAYQYAPAASQFYPPTAPVMQPAAVAYDTRQTYYTPLAITPNAQPVVYASIGPTYQHSYHSVPQTYESSTSFIIPASTIPSLPPCQTTSYLTSPPHQLLVAPGTFQSKWHSKPYSSLPSQTQRASYRESTPPVKPVKSGNYGTRKVLRTIPVTPDPKEAPVMLKTSEHTKSDIPNMQLHYCHVCKISCSGQEAYIDHLDSEGHKNMESSQSVPETTTSSASKTSDSVPTPPSTGPGGFSRHYCKVCRLSCMNAEAYSVHVLSAKHKNALELEARNGKSLPYRMQLQVASYDHSKLDGLESFDTNVTDLNATISPDIQAVGLDYVDEISHGSCKAASFNCRLCECKFTDRLGKLVHCKGRKHRVQYKKKVDPNLVLDIKVTSRTDDLETLVRQEAKNEAFVKHLLNEKWKMESEQRRFEEHLKLSAGAQSSAAAMRRADVYNDQHVNAKHTLIYPTEDELEKVQAIVSSCELALKAISNNFSVSEDGHPVFDSIIDDESKDKVLLEQNRLIRGIVRVGLMAKGLLLRGDSHVELVVLCILPPTKNILNHILDTFQTQLSSFSKQLYTVESCIDKACFTVSGPDDDDSKTVCTIMVTSPVLRDQTHSDSNFAGMSWMSFECALDTSHCKSSDVTTTTDDTLSELDEVLDRSSCLAALAAVRRAKWFQARANGLPSCVIILRVLRDLCHRLPVWSQLSQWSLELLVEKCLSTVGDVGLNPGDALRRVFECLASGILLPGGCGLMDPCEKDLIDTVSDLSAQQRDDITAAAQYALRMMAFRKIYEILDMNQLTPWSNSGRQKRRTSGAGVLDDAVAEHVEKTRKIEDEPETSK